MSAAGKRLWGVLALAGLLCGAGCVGPADNFDPPGQTTHALLHQGIERSYRLYVPSDPATPLPLVLAFHGRLGSGREMSRMTRFNTLAERERFIVAYPDAVDGIWNDGRDSGASVDDVGFTRAVIERVREAYEIDPRRIYATGYSNGGHMVNRLVLQMDGVLAAAAPVASLLARDLPFLSPAPTVRTPILMLHGTTDPITPFDGGASSLGFGVVYSAAETVDYWVEAQAASPDAVSETLPDHDSSDGTRATRETHRPPSSQGADVVFIRIDGGGHAWPGTDQPLSSLLIGATSRDLSATEEIWAFFARHAR